MEDEQKKQEIIEGFLQNPLLAHRVLFPHRHKDSEAEFHPEIISLFNSGHKRVALIAFRGSAKSTLVEETVVLKALFGKKKYILVVGASWSSACDRLFSIKNEIENNESIIEVFGEQKGEQWAADAIVLSNGCKIQAVGAGQALRGKKHGTERPDLVVIDDLEEEENVATKEARHKIMRWMDGVLIPCLHPTQGDILFIGTPLHPEALIEKKRQESSWVSKIYPICYMDLKSGVETSSWPSRFPMSLISEMRNNALLSGSMTEFQQEFMCKAEDISGKPFQASMIKISPVVATYMPIYIIVDPARTVNKNSARTGYIAASWMSNRLIVHDALGAFHRPDETIQTIFEWNEKYQPIYIGVESNSLEEYIMQPLRARMIEKGISLPLLDLRAPKDKLEFIKSLQPFYISNSVVHAKPLPDLENELVAFPTGRVDVINALAYMLKIKAGRPVYEDMTSYHVAPILEHSFIVPRYLVVSSRPAMTSAVVVQLINDEVHILRDWIKHMPPAECLGDILRQAVAEFGELNIGAPLEQFDKFLNNGLPAAAIAQHVQLHKYSATVASEGSLREWLQKQHRGLPCFLVSTKAKWTLNGIGGGYARSLDKHGQLSSKPTDNHYALVLEAIESFINFIDKAARNEQDDSNRNYAHTNNGRRYLTTLPGGR